MVRRWAALGAVGVIVVVGSLAALGVRAGAEQGEALRVSWVRPVGGPVVEPFRPPSTPYGPGHRGVTFAVEPGTPVHAAGAGVVTFVGTIADVTWVVVGHAGGLRTTYGYLATTAVATGDPVAPGHVIGTVGPAGRCYFGLRRGATYLDPMRLFRPRIRLVRPR
ncbi:MAG: murein hydrolase activator EnvC family protein [Acidimicrobiia bacterium]